MNTKSIFLLCTFVSVFLFSCKKNQLGGKITVTGTVSHHSKAISNAMVFIKFKAREFPGSDTNTYDAKVRADAAGNFSFKCYKGDYYLYGYGYDFSIPAPYRVVGGLPLRVRKKGEKKITLAVTED